ncbi:MAG: glutaredoxin domain-containing protein [Betaproteobacteria bacterium]
MRTNAISLVWAFVMLAMPLHAAQLYRWVDEKGNVEWRDTPPPATAKKVEQRSISASTIPTSELPYSLQQAVKNFPVTLWATDCGELCDRGRAHLKRRGVPYTERDPRTDFEAFKKAAGGGGEVPFLLVGNTRLKGYFEAEWDSALDIAGYPKTAIAVVKPKVVAAKPAAASPSASIVRLYTSSDCGPPCAQAKQLLGSRGVPFQEIVADANPAMDELRKLSGDIFVPTLVAGRLVVRSFVAADYHNALDQAGFGKMEAPKP